MDDTEQPTHCTASIKGYCKPIPARWVVALMSFFGIFNMCSLRVNLSAAIVAMVDYEQLEKAYMSQYESGSGASNESGYEISDLAVRCEGHGAFSLRSAANATFLSGKHRRLFAWDENTQGLVLGAYFYGYTFSQIFGAWLGRKIGRVKVWGSCILVASSCTMLLPVASNLGLPMVVALRVVIGFFSSVSFPLMHGMVGVWGPPAERGRFIAIQYAGMPTATIVVLPISGYLAEEFGWESVFYVTGAGAALWACIWLAIVYDYPSKHPRISEEERDYIEASLHPEGKQSVPTAKQPIPWLSMLTSIRYWCVVVAHCATSFSTQLFDNLLPTYLKTVLNFDITASGALSSVPSIAKLCIYPAAGWMADWIVSKGVKRIYVRKACAFAALVIPGAAMATVGYVGCNATVAILLFTISVGFESFTIPGVKATMVEIAPAFCGITYAIANTLSMTSGFTAPQIAGVLRESHRDNPIQGWIMLFWLAAIVQFAAVAMFMIFASSDVQPWARVKPREEKREEEAINQEGESTACHFAESRGLLPVKEIAQL